MRWYRVPCARSIPRERLAKKPSQPFGKVKRCALMTLEREVSRKLRDALVEAFPTYDKLRMMVKHQLGKNLAAIAKEGPLPEVAFDLIAQAESEGWVVALVDGATMENPGNEALRAVAQQIMGARPQEGSKPAQADRASRTPLIVAAALVATIGVAVAIYFIKSPPPQTDAKTAPLPSTPPPVETTSPSAPVQTSGPTKPRDTSPLPGPLPPKTTSTAPPSPSATTLPLAPTVKSGTATRSGGFWSLGVPREALGPAQFVCLDPSPAPAELHGVQPTCSLLNGSGVAQCTRSDKARDVPIGDSVSWRLCQ